VMRILVTAPGEFTGDALAVGRHYNAEPADTGTQAQNRAFHALVAEYWVSGCHSYNARSYEDLRKCVKRDLGAGIEKATIYVHPLKGSPLPDGAEVWQLKSWADYTKKERRETIDNLKNEMIQAGVNSRKFEEILRGMEGSYAGTLESF